MNLPGSSVYGVDVTDGTLKAVQLVRRGRTLRLVGSWRIPYHRDEDPARGAVKALRTFLQTARPDGLAQLVLSAPDRGHVSRTYLVPAMDPGRVAELVRYELLAELQLPEEDLLLRHHVRKGVVEQQVHALALEAGPVNAFLSALQAERVPFDELQPPGYALASFVEHERPLGRDRVLLGVGETSTELVLMREDGLWTRHLPLGRAQEEDPARLAERLALEVEAATRFLLPRDVEFKPVDVVLTEEGALGPQLTTELKRVLRLPVTRFGELPRIDTDHLKHGSATEAQTLAMGKALGLALTGCGLARFPCAVVRGTPRRDATRRLPLAGVSLTLSALGLLGVTQLAVARADALEDALSGDLPGEMRALVARSDETRGQLSDRLARADGLLSLARRRPAVLAVRTALSRVAEVVAGRGSETLHVDSVWLSTGDGGRPGVLTITLDADPRRDEALPGALAESFRGVPGEVAVEGPERAPTPGLSRWTVEVTLP